MSYNFTQDEIQSFIGAWNRDFNEVLTPEAAHSELARLLDFFSTMAREFHKLEKAEAADSTPSSAPHPDFPKSL